MNNLIPIEFQSQRILTTQQIAESYGTSTDIINQNYGRNNQRYVQGKHFFLLEGAELKEFKASLQFEGNLLDEIKFAPKLQLWTEKGAWLHAKSLGTNEAWEAYEMLVDDYFQKKELSQAIMNDPIMLMRYEQIKMEQRLSQVEVDADDAKVQIATIQEQAELAHIRINVLDAVDPEGTPRQQLVKSIRRYAEKNGLTYDTGWNKFRESYNIAFHTNLQMLRNNYMKKNGIKKMTMPEYLEAANKIDDALRVAHKMLHPVYQYELL